MGKTNIEWATDVWNPVRGCSRVSEGCRFCYAEIIAARFSDSGMPYEELATRTSIGPRWTGKVQFIEKHLFDPIKWKAPRRIFVASMSDPNHEKVPNSWRDQMLAVMIQAPQHKYLWLTKRADNMLAYFADPHTRNRVAAQLGWRPERMNNTWPIPGLWLGVSVENQATADERIPLLLETPAAIRWISYEPALGVVDFSSRPMEEGWYHNWLKITETEPPIPRLDWIVCGGESGSGARPFDLTWARQTIIQCTEAGIPAFIKQLGSTPVNGTEKIHLIDRKGGDLDEWPEDLRVREFPDA